MKLKKITAVFLAVLLCICAMSVSVSAESEKKGVSIKYHKTTMFVGETLDLTPKVTGFEKYTLVLTTENKYIATISKEGVVTAHSEGKVKIKVKVKGTKYGAQCTIEVKSPDGSVNTAANGAAIPDPAAFFGTEASESGSISSSKGDGYYLNLSLNLDTDKKGVDEYKKLLSDEYNFTFCSSGQEDFSFEGTDYTTKGLIYNGKENVSDILLWLKGNSADAFILVNYYNGSGRIGFSLYYSSDITVSDMGDRASYVTDKKTNGTSGGSSGGTSGGSTSGGTSGGSSGGSSWKKGSGVTVKCVKCHGSGKITCPRCNGSGTTSSYSSPSPNYSGKKGGSKTGTSKSLCSKCKGSGDVTCTRCHGDGTE